MFCLGIEKDLELRELEENDTDDLFALVDHNREYLRQWLPWLDKERTRMDSLNFIRGAREQSAANMGLVAGIWYRQRLAGVISYNSIDWANRIVHIGYWVGAGFQGRGIVTRACSAMIDYAFFDLQLNRIEIRCATENRRSCAIPERLGFKREGIVRQAEWLYDHFVDHHVFGLLAGEWIQ